VQLFARLKGKRAGKMDSHLLKDFVKAGDVPAALIQKYQNKLPEELLAIWRHYGFGAFCNIVSVLRFKINRSVVHKRGIVINNV